MKLESVSPNTGSVFAHWTGVPEAEAHAATSALAASARQLATDRTARVDALTRAIDAVRTAGTALASMTVQEVGKTPAEAAGEVDYAISFLETARTLVETYSFDVPIGDGRSLHQMPLGLSLLIAPYNDPIAGLTRKIGPSLAAGAGAVVKPSELGVQTAAILADAFDAAGLGDVVRVLPLADRGAVLGLIEHPEIGVVSFTGSTAAGRQIARAAGAALTPVVCELGGTNPFVVLADADLDAAVADLTVRKAKAAGQACSAQNVVYVERPVFEEVRDRIAAAFAALQTGASNAPGVTMGPVRTAEVAARASALGQRVAAEGGQCVAGGVPAAFEGPFAVPLTAFEAPMGSVLETEEVFAPMCAVTCFDDRDALQSRLAANRQPLVLYVYGADEAAITSLIAPLRYGSIGVNTTAIQGPDVPTGGFRDAGYGREGGLWGVEAFLAPINRRWLGR